MPRYFFATKIGDALIPDPTGTVLADADRAWAAARDTIRAAMAEPGTQSTLMTACLVVTDEDGEIVLEFPFSEALDRPVEDRSLH